MKEVSTPVAIAVIVAVLIVVVGIGVWHNVHAGQRRPPPQLSVKATNARGQLIVPQAGTPPGQP